MQNFRRGIALPIAGAAMLVGIALWLVYVVTGPGSGGPAGLYRHGASIAFAFVDGEDGTVRVANPGQRPQPTASAAKVITALAVLGKAPLVPGEEGPVLTMTEADSQLYWDYATHGGSVVAVGQGQELTQYEILEAMLLPSANNLADTLAIWAFGSIDGYRSAATQLVRSLGMKATTIGEDASGFSPTTTSTAEDLTRLATAAMREPVIAEIVARPEAVIPGVGPVRNTNWLLGQQGVVGLKTGTTDAAGGVFLFAATVGTPGRLVVGAVQGEGRSADDAIDRASALIAEIAATES
ncbi:D-alanyl-D-alanine carboxypeptidase [Rhodococcus sp. ABRD24]|uniref:D-alanyl-D-alanine carboxypeptidase family protein n=1 Tax=Rhodococcus sp. ABRD24 TaxID=2507582 RepID=UPI00103DF962|nr:D-alanyl-D-alanine carboxypeptidase [Rhodococcus sp. ABRD24]QBJ96285.1 D-alanyl-D-alanine carboxypeptidase [Rhodococcus sp. ABRD24]